MQEFENINDILGFAIVEEEGAYKFYTDLACKMERPEMTKVFSEFAQEELEHRNRLFEIKQGGGLSFEATGKVTDLKLSDYLVAKKPSLDMDYQDALVLAMKKEKAAFKLYSDLAAKAGSDAIKTFFLALAQEEAKHKLRFELEYDDFLGEN